MLLGENVLFNPFSKNLPLKDPPLPFPQPALAEKGLGSPQTLAGQWAKLVPIFALKQGL
jgi:hypothetical protein